MVMRSVSETEGKAGTESISWKNMFGSLGMSSSMMVTETHRIPGALKVRVCETSMPPAQYITKQCNGEMDLCSMHECSP